MSSEPFYDPAKSYIDNFEHGLFGFSAGATPNSQSSEFKHPFTEHPGLSDAVKGRA
jgi:hypothetical protein